MLVTGNSSSGFCGVEEVPTCGDDGMLAGASSSASRSVCFCARASEGQQVISKTTSVSKSKPSFKRRDAGEESA